MSGTGRGLVVAELLVKRDGRVYIRDNDHFLGTVKKSGKGWISECACQQWRAPAGTQNLALWNLIDHVERPDA